MVVVRVFCVGVVCEKFTRGARIAVIGGVGPHCAAVGEIGGEFFIILSYCEGCHDFFLFFVFEH